MRASFLIYAILITTGIQLLKATPVAGQNISEIMITIEAKNESLKNIFGAIEAKTKLRISYITENVEPYTNIDLSHAERSVKEVLDLVLSGTPLTFYQVDNFVFVERKTNDIPESMNATSSLKKDVVLFFTVTGTVTDAQNSQPMAGVNIVVKGTTKGTATDASGKFAIDANDNDILVFSFIGFKTIETQVNGRTVIDIPLEVDIKALQEVEVNAGYWKVREKEKTGNIAKVSFDEIEKQPIVNPLQALHGRMPGVYIQQVTGIPGSNFNIQIRGRNSLRIDGNDPLYIVDGVPFSSQSLSSIHTTSGIFSGGASPLNGISTADIESIEVLKDADATAIYGSRGANGVVLITTKHGKAGKTKFSVNAYTGIAQITRKMDLLNTAEYLEMRNEAFTNDASTPRASDYDVNGTWDQTRYTDWQEVLLGGNAKTNSAQASLSGGNETTTFNLSATFRRETTVFPGDFRYLKGSSHLSINHLSPNKRLSASFTLGYNFDNNNQPFSDLTSASRRLAPNAPALFTPTGDLNWENYTWNNPLAELEQTYLGKNYTMINNGVFGYEVLPGLQIKTSLGLNNIRSREMSNTPSTSFNPSFGLTSESASSNFSSGDLQSWIVEPQINWKKQIRAIQLDLLLGSTFQSQEREQSSTYAQGFSSDALLGNLAAASTIYVLNHDKTKYRYNAFFGRINFNWNSKYIINLTGRRDGSSRFGPGNQFANFGAVGVAWIYSNENWFKNHLSILSFGKLRASYGKTGSDQIGDYQYLTTYSPSNRYQGVASLEPTRLSNSEFAWEANKKFEIALELGFLQDRILLTGSYYNNTSSNQLVGYSLPNTTGFSSVTANLPATVRNYGAEIELRTINISNNAFEWESSFNLTISRNKLVEFPNLESSTYSDRYVVGESLFIQKLYHYEGIDPTTGTYQMKDFNGDGQITSSADRGSIKNVALDYFGGLNNSLRFKRIKLDFLFQFVRQTGYNMWYGGFLAGAVVNQPKEILDRWQSEGDEARFQRYTSRSNTPAGRIFSSYRYSDVGVGDASFIRLKTISLSYDLPLQGIPAKGSIYVQGQNLLTITKYKGLDPEAQLISRLPPLKGITLGIQLTF